MKAIGIVLALVFVLLLAFTLLNWGAFTAPAPLSIGVAVVHAPLGVVMLAACALLTAIFVVFLVYQQAAALVAARRAARDLDQQRRLADQAEASRVAELRSYLEGALGKRSDGAAGATTLDQLESTILDRLRDVENALAAHLAEVEDKVDRALVGIPRSPSAR